MSMNPDAKARARALVLASLSTMTDAEDAAITAAALSDPDNPPLAEGAVLVPAVDALPVTVTRKRGQRGPGKQPAKVQVSVRLEPDVLAYYQSTGRGWQARLNEDLKKNISKTGA